MNAINGLIIEIISPKSGRASNATLAPSGKLSQSQSLGESFSNVTPAIARPIVNEIAIAVSADKTTPIPVAFCALIFATMTAIFVASFFPAIVNASIPNLLDITAVARLAKISPASRCATDCKALRATSLAVLFARASEASCAVFLAIASANFFALFSAVSFASFSEASFATCLANCLSATDITLRPMKS